MAALDICAMSAIAAEVDASKGTYRDALEKGGAADTRAAMGQRLRQQPRRADGTQPGRGTRAPGSFVANNPTAVKALKHVPLVGTIYTSCSRSARRGSRYNQ